MIRNDKLEARQFVLFHFKGTLSQDQQKTFRLRLITFKVTLTGLLKSPVPEFIDPVFAKTSLRRSFSVIENERFGLVFAKTGSINSGTGLIL